MGWDDFLKGELDLDTQVLRVAWDEFHALGQCGEWWTGPEKIAIAAETRVARDCELCARKKAALSPYAIAEKHRPHGVLPEIAVEAIHRITSDPGRLSSRWHREVIDQGLREEALVEMVAILATVIAIDTLAESVDAARPELPPAREGEPRRARPEGAKVTIARVATVAPGEAEGELAEYYARLKSPIGPPPHIMQSMTLVPRAQIAFQRLMAELYINMGAEMDDLTSQRALKRPQLELLATRISAANDCFY
jgi:hypothetical protein